MSVESVVEQKEFCCEGQDSSTDAGRNIAFQLGVWLKERNKSEQPLKVVSMELELKTAPPVPGFFSKSSGALRLGYQDLNEHPTGKGGQYGAVVFFVVKADTKESAEADLRSQREKWFSQHLGLQLMVEDIGIYTPPYNPEFFANSSGALIAIFFKPDTQQSVESK